MTTSLVSSMGWLMRALPLSVILAATGASAQSPTSDVAARAADVLRGHLQQRHELDRVELQLVGDAPAASPEGASEWTFRAGDEPLRRRMSVWIVRQASPESPAIRLDFEVRAHVMGWRLAAEGAAEQALGAGNAAAVELDAIRHPDALRAADLSGYRLRQRLPAGHVIRPVDVARAGTILRGQSVDVVYRFGAITIRTRGRALEQASVGQALRLAVAGSREPVHGVAAAPGTVDVTDKQELQ